MNLYKSKEVLYTNCACFLVASCAIIYLLVRHSLLVRGKLRPEDVACGDCTRALLAGYHSNARSNDNDDDSSIHEKLHFYGTFSSLLFYFLYCIETAIVYMSMLGWFPGYCRAAIPVGAFLYQNAKCSLYVVFTARLCEGFHGSAYAYSKWFIQALYGSVLVFGVTMNVLFVLFTRGKRMTIDGSGERAHDGGHVAVHYCAAKAPVYIFAFVALFDLVFNVLLVYLFAVSLKAMLRDFANNTDANQFANDLKRNAHLYLLPLKYAVISTVAVVSTLLSVVVLASTQMATLLPFDCIVNSVALVLMTTYWEPVYEWMCSPLLRCVTLSPCLPCTDLSETEVKQLVSAVSPQRTRVMTSSFVEMPTPISPSQLSL